MAALDKRCGAGDSSICGSISSSSPPPSSSESCIISISSNMVCCRGIGNGCSGGLRSEPMGWSTSSTSFDEIGDGCRGGIGDGWSGGLRSEATGRSTSSTIFDRFSSRSFSLKSNVETGLACVLTAFNSARRSATREFDSAVECCPFTSENGAG